MIIGISGKIGSGKDTVGKIIQYLTYPEWTTPENVKVRNEAPYSIEDWLHPNYGISNNHPSNTWHIKKFAGKLKQIVALLTGCSIEDLESQEFKNKQLGEEWNYYRAGLKLRPTLVTKEISEQLGDGRIYKYTYREMLQKIGTESMRDVIHENIWINALFTNYIQDAGYKHQIEPVGQLGMSSEQLFKVKTPPQTFNNGYPNWIVTDTRFANEAKAIKDRNGIIIRVSRVPKLEKGDKVKFYYSPDREDEVLKDIEDHRGRAIILSDGTIGRETDVKWCSKYQNHPSECSLDDYDFDYFIDNDDTIEKLIDKVKQILIKEKLI